VTSECACLRGAEDNLVVSLTGARECACLVILRVTISIEAAIFKKFGIVCKSTASKIAAIFDWS
jgi:hypothetical protein